MTRLKKICPRLLKLVSGSAGLQTLRNSGSKAAVALRLRSENLFTGVGRDRSLTLCILNCVTVARVECGELC